MKRVVLLLAAGMTVLAQERVLSPAAEFDLGASRNAHHAVHRFLSYLVPNPNGLTLVRIGENILSLTSSDPDGRILHVRTDLASVHAQIYAALPRPDGSVWLVSSGPHGLSEGFGVATGIGSALPARSGPARNGQPTNETELDLYNSAGEHLESLRLLAEVTGAESPIAAGNDLVVLRTANVPHFARPQLIHFGTVTGGRFTERTEVRLAPPVTGDIPVLAGNGDLLLIGRTSGNMVVIDPRTKGDSVVRLPRQQRIQAAAADSDSVYLLFGNAVVKADLSGKVISTYRFQFRRAFEPDSIGVTGNSLYLVDRTGFVERFQTN